MLPSFLTERYSFISAFISLEVLHQLEIKMTPLKRILKEILY